MTTLPTPTWCAIETQQLKPSHPLGKPDARWFFGRMTVEMIAGCQFLRIDIPAKGKAPERTVYLAPAVVTRIEPINEQLVDEAMATWKA